MRGLIPTSVDLGEILTEPGDLGLSPPGPTAYDAVAVLAAEQFRQVAAHAHLDAVASWRQAPSRLLAHLEMQLAEIRLLLPDRADIPPLVPVQAARFRVTCANAANYLAFLAAHARRVPPAP